MTGRIIKIISNLYTVESNDKTYECRARGLFRNNKIIPLVGDIVEFDENEKYILEIGKRKNELNRPCIANIDCAIIVTSVKRPDYSSALLDKMLTNIILSDIEPIIVFTKLDLLSKDEVDFYNKIIEYYNNIGIKTLTNDFVTELENIIENKTVCVTGQTGAGKSTLLNKIDERLSLKTDDISDALGRGKHTTRHVELYKIKNFYIADTPGFSALDLNVDKENIRFAFYEFNNDLCKFRDCKHINEVGCNVKEEVENGSILKSRYENYRNMVIK